ncbi:FAD-dependent oxidoreductase [Cellulomonas sp. PhB143]|uniref:FAD-dependent oxidoreductase n=1 Tax=Cellulomonas sp. PhB143 TaxID=2485186 RepID=UPI000F470560|nr:FAD-dependent oxidoreductase [Cellulomonas sp. PhB143]ROS76584.1 assimilatory nitrate reductase electron transfer subunit [Cellulomonas sp. PhB143]
MDVVVIGHGMVGSRFVDDLLARTTEARVTVLGAEPYEPYNRVLLSDVVAGRTGVAAITLPAPDDGRARVRRGVAAVAMDRRARTVLDDAGGAHRYDALVLATGARARVPDLLGLSTGPGAGLPPGVHALRTLDDAREIVAAAANAPRTVVVGGGVLGVEAAQGLAARGLDVTLVHGAPGLMDRQLDAAAGAVLAGTLERAGVRPRTGARPSQVLLVDGHVVGVRLDGRTATPGEVLPAGLVVLAAGAVPETALAREAGLETDRGVVVGHDLATGRDPRVFAIGDCAQPPDGSRGLVAEGWDHARRLADHLAALAHEPPAAWQNRLPGTWGRPSAALRLGAPLASRAAGSVGVRGTDVVTVKGLSVVAMGVCGARRAPDPAHRSVVLSDPASGRHVEIVVAGDVLVGATCLGDAQVAADLTSAYTRRTPVPADPAHLLLTSVTPHAAHASSPEHMPSDAVVCRCNTVTKGQIADCCADGATELADVARATRATTGCGSCTKAVCGILEWARGGRAPALAAHGS